MLTKPIPQLPGGLVVDGELRKSYRFRPITGALETRLSELSSGAASYSDATYPQIVSAALECTLDRIADEPASLELVNRLSVGDRQFLLKELAALLDNRVIWVTAHCGKCHEPMDVSFRFQQLPTKQCSAQYPSQVVVTTIGRLVARSPNGSDQCAIAALEDEQQAVAMLLSRILSAVDGGAQPAVDRLTAGDRQHIEAALESMSPEVTDRLLAVCPACEAHNQVPVDVFDHLGKSTAALLLQVHQLASHYHWSESEILNLPRQRRLSYLQLIDRARGLASRETGIEVMQ